MKKLFIFLFSFGLISTTFAQSKNNRQNYPNNNNDRSTVYERQSYPGNDRSSVYRGGDDRRDVFTAKERDMQIKAINRDYDAQVRSIRRSRYSNNYETSRIVRRLENERQQKIQVVLDRFEHQGAQYRGGMANNNRRY